MMRPEGGTSNPNSHSLSATEPSDDSPASQFFAQTSLAQQRVQSFLDSTTPFVSRRWGLTSFLLLLFVLRIVFSQAWYIVCYALFIYLLNLFLAFLQPKFDPGLQADLAELDVEEGEPGLPTSNSNGASYGKMNGGANGGGGGGGLMSGMFGNDTLTGNGNGQGDEEFRPFIRRLPEFKSSSSKIPPVDSNPPSNGGSFSGGAGYRNPPGPGAPAGRAPNGFGSAQQGYNQGGTGYGQQGSGYGQQGGQGGYGGQVGQPQPYQDRFPNAKPPSGNLGKGYDEMYGTSQNQRNGNNSYSRGGVTDQDLEAEYGSRGGGGGGAGRTEYDEYGGSNNNNGYGRSQDQEGERNEEDDEVEAVKQQMRFTKQESLSSTRNALRLAREAEETASGSLLKLGDQSEKIANTERHLDMAKSHSSRADDNAREITALNRSIFRPNFQLNKQGKRDAEEARILNRHIEERDERERVRAEALKAQNRVDQTMGGPGSGRFTGGRFGSDRFGSSKSQGQNEEEKKQNKMKQRGRFQFEATGSDDELEDELDGNLDEISQLSGRLNNLGRAMGTEIDDQNERIKRLQDKTTRLDERVYGSTQKLDRIK